MARSFEANSSLESPATQSRPSTYAMSVIDCGRGLRRSAGVATGGFGSSTRAYFIASNETRSIFPAPSTRKSAAVAPVPWPRITERYAFFVMGWIARSVIVICAASVPASAAIF